MTNLREFRIADVAEIDYTIGTTVGYVVWHKTCNYRLPLKVHYVDNLEELVALAEDHKCPDSRV